MQAKSSNTMIGSGLVIALAVMGVPKMSDEQLKNFDSLTAKAVLIAGTIYVFSKDQISGLACAVFVFSLMNELNTRKTKEAMAPINPPEDDEEEYFINERIASS